jgi:hypothetical protein
MVGTIRRATSKAMPRQLGKRKRANTLMHTGIAKTRLTGGMTRRGITRMIQAKEAQFPRAKRNVVPTQKRASIHA